MTSGTNTEYRDRLFKFIFGNPEHKKWTLSLYNAINGSNYTDENEIEINTIEDVVYMGMKNDVSFLIDDTMNLYEQQSTRNLNMPLRFLIYSGMLCGKYVRKTKLHLYGTSRKEIPTPQCVCFYNGKKDEEDRFDLKLSDSFKKKVPNPDVEVTVHMLNINYGRNKELLGACKPLSEYSWFVNEVVKNQEACDELGRAIDAALDAMPEDFELKEFLLDNRAEVKQMCITEYDEEQTLAQEREEGIEIGLERGTLLTLADLVQDGILTLTQAAKKANMPEEEFEEKLETLKSELQSV